MIWLCDILISQALADKWQEEVDKEQYRIIHSKLKDVTLSTTNVGMGKWTSSLKKKE